jgi:uncharacterized 2Fe-2S/4Fe-4S cluster protein (DUF4445 family)
MQLRLSRDLKDELFARGVEFPCGGVALCGGCRIRVVEGSVPITPEMEEVLTPTELAAGWRLACFAQPQGEIVVEIGQWETPVLSDDSVVPFEPSTGYGAVVDLGTTTLVAQLLSFETGEVEQVRTALNPQSANGADVMTRVEFDLREPDVLTQTIRSAIGDMLADWPVREVLLVGNTAMHHLFCGLSVEPLSHVPFETPHGESQVFRAGELGWSMPDARIEFLPCLGGFVGSDILAGIVATGLSTSERPVALVDLGTNGEIAIGDRNGIVCASTAAGPAFEAGRIRMGMRAATGAISSVAVRDGGLSASVIGGGPARGICGSGLVDAVAAVGTIAPSGRIADGTRRFAITDTVGLVQSDIRELQLAKGAIAAGLQLLNASRADHLCLAGAFGNYVDIRSARRIGLLPEVPARVVPSGNTALRGAKTLLLAGSRREAMVESARSKTRHVSLNSLPEFQESFVACMPLL